MESNDDVLEKQYEDAAYAYTMGEFNTAIAGFSQLTENGHASAAAYLAQMYLRGEGTPVDIVKGLELLQLAASLGNSTAAFNLGALYKSGGYGVPRDPDKSRQFFLLAKELGCDTAIDEFI